MNSNNPLDQLKPIVLPDHGTSFWPLAPGWWFLIIMLSTLAVIVIFLRPVLKRRRQRKEVQSNTIELLNQLYKDCIVQKELPIAIQNYLQKSNEIFKRVVHATPLLGSYSNLTGKSWTDFILTVDPDSKFPALYGDNLYASRCNEKINLADLHQWSLKLVTILPKKAKKIVRDSRK